MASTTSNLGLTKPAGTDKALVSVINTNSDILDRSAGGLMDAIAIVANGNTHAAISAGQYVYVHNHGTLAEGLYTANSAIAANATLTTSNLTADASGGLNALNSNLNSFTAITPTVYSNRVNIDLSNCYKIGRWVLVYLKLHSNQALNQNTALTGFPVPAAKMGLPVNISGANAEIRTNAGDGMVIEGIATNTDFVISGVYNTLQD